MSNLEPVRKADGAEVLAEIDNLIPKVAEAEVNLSGFRTAIGLLLSQVREHGFWRLAGAQGFGAYMESLEGKFNVKRTQLYHYMGIVEDLLPDVGAAQLGAMGLEKAKILRHEKQLTGHMPEQSVIDAATDRGVSVRDFRQLLTDGRPLPPESDGMKWHTLDYVTSADKQKTILRGFEVARRVDPVDHQTVPAEIVIGNSLEKMSQEMDGTYGALVEEGTA